MKTFAWRKCRKIFLEAIYFSFEKTFFKVSAQNFRTMCYLHWCYTFCTGVSLFALMLRLNCAAPSQSESSNFFVYIIKGITIPTSNLKHNLRHKGTAESVLIGEKGLNLTSVSKKD